MLRENKLVIYCVGQLNGCWKHSDIFHGGPTGKKKGQIKPRGDIQVLMQTQSRGGFIDSPSLVSTLRAITTLTSVPIESLKKMPVLLA